VHFYTYTGLYTRTHAHTHQRIFNNTFLFDNVDVSNKILDNTGYEVAGRQNSCL